MVLPVSVTGQSPAQTEFLPADWGISDLQQVRFGEVGMLLEAAGPRLVVYELETDWSPPSPSAAAPHGATPELSSDRLVVSRLRAGNRNALGGYFNIFARAPASGVASLTMAPDSTRALLIDCSVEGTGFCGAWMHLFDFRLPPAEREFLDATPFSAITFWVWTDQPDDQVLLKVADAAWEAREDAPPTGLLHEFVASGHLGPQWQRVVVPIDRLDRSVDRSTLASIILQSVAEGHTRTYVRDVVFVVDPDDEGLAIDDTSPPHSEGSPLGPHRATWVWNTEELLNDRQEADRTVAFLARQGVDFVFLQIPDGPEWRRAPGERILEPDHIRPLVARLSAAGIRVYALDGAAWFANPPYHDGVVKTVEHVVAYNAAVAPEERFYGVRYDIEPYLLPGFHGPARDRILSNFLTLVERIVKTAHAGDLAVGLDIPFWYDAPNERTFAKVNVEWNGVTRPASHQLIDLVDDVSIMAYRTTGYGADGTISHSESEVRFAAEHGKRVFIGLETAPLPDEILLRFWDAPRRGFTDAPANVDRLLFVPAGDSIQVIWSAAGSARADLESVLAPGADLETATWWPVRRKVDVPAAKLTFSEMSPRRLEDVQIETAFELSKYPSFAGFALHHAVSWRTLLDHR